MNDTRWLTATYHFPSLYSIRAPMSSPLAAKALPTPGPATVQKALIRASIERFGIEVTRNVMFAEVVSGVPYIQPPEHIAISDQLLHMLKSDDSGNLVEGVGYREFAHAQGAMKICMPVDCRLADMFTEVFYTIGYWGQSHSFTCCTDVTESEWQPGSYAVPLDTLEKSLRLGRYFTAYVSELVTTKCSWDTVVDGSSDADHLRLRLYVWPLTACEHLGGGCVWRSCSLLW